MLKDKGLLIHEYFQERKEIGDNYLDLVANVKYIVVARAEEPSLKTSMSSTNSCPPSSSSCRLQPLLGVSTAASWTRGVPMSRHIRFCDGNPTVRTCRHFTGGVYGIARSRVVIYFTLFHVVG